MAKERRFWDRLRGKAGLALPGLGALAIVSALQLIGFSAVDRVGLLLFDTYQRTAPREYKDGPVRVIDIDDESIRQVGQWPWPRTDIAKLTRQLTDAGASVVAYDVVFSEPDRTSPTRLAEQAQRDGAPAETIAALQALPDNDAVLAGAFAETPTLLAYFLTHDGKGGQVEPKAGIAVAGTMPETSGTFTGSIQSLPALRDAAPGSGFVTLVPDSDGIIRRAPMILTQNGALLPSLSTEALRMAQGAGSIIVKSSNASGESGGDGASVVGVKNGDFEIPTTDAGELWMYYTAPHPERIVPAWKVLGGKLSEAQMRDAFEGRIVFIGTSAQGLYDLKSTPLQQRELGVMVHAQAVEQMYFKQFLQRPDWAPGLERSLLLALGIVMALLLPWMGAARGAVLGAVMVGGMALGSWLAFRQQHFLLDPTYPVLALTAVYLVETAYTYWREERQRAYIHRAFDRYLSPDLVKRIVDDPSRLELGGEEREMTVLFCDIRGFSRISERLGPQEIIRFLIAFLTPMCDILLAKRATIDKFIGDAILAFWNAPLDDPDQYGNAARGALAMVERLKQLNVEMAAQSVEPWPGDVQIGIGLNAGPCCVGNMGSAQRLSYSLIGDTVNLASRIEGLTKYYGVTIAIGEDLQARLREFATVELDRVRVVGRDAPETVHALIGDEALAGSEDFRAFVASHDTMLLAYRTQDWSGALALVDAQAGAADSYGLGKLYALMRTRIEAYRAAPPGTDWDGVFGATEK
ncbi:MAG: adenylate/guanylate cyclase domain-containing protein [Pseudomonadota bacterium]